MIFNETILKGAFILDLEKRKDDRGFFSRTFCADEFKNYGLNQNFLQANISRTASKNSLRGMHYQTQGAEESKLVRCTKGGILDVIIDIRKGSKTFGKHVSVELTESNYKQIYVPEGFAHGFLSLTDNVEVSYLVSAFYAPRKEAGIRWNDPLFNIDWPTKKPILSEKDEAYEDFLV